MCGELASAATKARGESVGNGFLQVRRKTCKVGCIIVDPVLVAVSYVFQQVGNRVS